MKTAKLFLAGMYLHLILSISVPIGILATGGWNQFSLGLFVFYLFMIGVMQLAGWICVGCAIFVYRKGNGENLRTSLKILKIYSIPFYLLNFVLSVAVWFVVVVASRGTLFFLIPIPIAVTCLIVFQSGCVGICYVMHLRRQPENQGKLSRIHYLMQIVPVLDVADTIRILRKAWCEQ